MTSMDYELDLSGLQLSIDPVKALQPVYRIMQRLSIRGFGAVFLAEDRNQKEYAVKVKKVFYKNARLRHERNILDRLYSADPTCFLKVVNYLPIKGHEFLVMERMGRSLQDLLEESPWRRLSKKSVLMFGIQAIKRIQTMHEIGILHRDVKPANFVIGVHGLEGIIGVIDFGISIIVDDWRTYNPYGSSPFCGELPFFFPNTESSIHDTIREQIVQRQEKSVEELCLDFPDLTNFTRLVLAIKKREEPDYIVLVRELERILRKNGHKNDGRFEWM